MTQKIIDNVKRKGSAKPRVIIITLIIASIVIIFGGKYWAYAHSHTSTDDAYVTGDNTVIAPQVSGTVKEVLVSENQPVKKGQVLAILDDSSYRIAVEQAEANLEVAAAQAKGAGVSVDLTASTGNAQIYQAQGLVEQADSGIASAKADVSRTSAAIINAQAVAKSAEANIKTAEAAVTSAISGKQRSADAINSVQASVDVAKVAYDKSVRDAARVRKLYASGAVSEQMSDQAESAELSAKAVLVSKEADLSAARQSLSAADASIDQAKAQLAAAHEQANAARAGINQAQAQKQATLQSVKQAVAKQHQAIGQLNQAHTAPTQVAVSQSAKTQAQAKVSQAKAALDDARLRLSYTRIIAPIDGTVSKKTVEVGALVQPGTPLMSVVNKSNLWVSANFKETQLSGMHQMNTAEVKVDALRGHLFKGHVESISAATGATFALLPPDNATGNFTKVVQRVPVKIVLDSDQPGLDDLRAGFSVTAIVSTR